MERLLQPPDHLSRKRVAVSAARQGLFAASSSYAETRSGQPAVLVSSSIR